MQRDLSGLEFHGSGPLRSVPGLGVDVDFFFSVWYPLGLCIFRINEGWGGSEPDPNGTRFPNGIAFPVSP